MSDPLFSVTFAVAREGLAALARSPAPGPGYAMRPGVRARTALPISSLVSAAAFAGSSAS